MATLRHKALLHDLRIASDISADFVDLNPTLAATEIDAVWWRTAPGSNARSTEPDSDWVWETLCQDAIAQDYWEAVCLKVPNDRIQGAMIYQVDAKSELQKGAGAIYVDNLATAPWNRKWVIETPHFTGIGSSLLLRAIHHSHLLALKGRVNLTSLPKAVDFYKKLGFLDTGIVIGDLPLLELPAKSARDWLEREGLVGYDKDF